LFDTNITKFIKIIFATYVTFVILKRNNSVLIFMSAFLSQCIFGFIF